VNNVKRDYIGPTLKFVGNGRLYSRKSHVLQNSYCILANRYDVSDRTVAAEEVLADMVRDGKTWALINRFISKVMQWVRKVFPGIKVTRAEARNLIERAETMVAREREGTATGINQFAQSVRFSLKEAANNITKSPAFKRWFGDCESEEGAGHQKLWNAGSLSMCLPTAEVPSGIGAYHRRVRLRQLFCRNNLCLFDSAEI
jgi:hypothetical protein